MTRPTNPHAAAWKGFTEQTTEHELHVIHDDGLYKHLRVQAPGTRMWSWDITTWPGHLATSGDIADGFMFSRETDMIRFFAHGGRGRDDYFCDGAPSIDVRYWAQKLCGGRSRDVKVYDPDTFLRQVREHLEEHEELGTDQDRLRDRQIALLTRIRELKHRGVSEDTSTTVQQRLEEYWRGELTLGKLFDQEGLSQSEMDQLGDEFDHDENGARAQFDLFDLESDVAQTPPAERREEILDDARWQAETEYQAHTWLDQNEEHVGSDTWEWDLREYDIHFLFTCYAIDMAVRLYREQHTQPVAD